MKIEHFLKKHKLLVVVIISAILCGMPFIIAAYRHSYILGDDIQTHMQRVEGMLSSYQAGHFPARLHLKTLSGFAYGMGFFYPQLILIIPVLFRIIGMNFILSTNGFMVLLNILTGISVYFCVYKITDSTESALSGAILSLVSHYHLINIFYRGSIGESAVFIFVPLVILGIYNIVHESKNGVLWMVFGISGVLFSHLLSFVIFIIFLLIILLILIPLLVKRKNAIRDIILALIISALITSYFWLPFLEQYFSVPLYVNTGYEAPYRPALRINSLFRFVSYWWREMPENFIDIIYIALPLAVFSMFLGEKKTKKIIFILLITGITGIILSSDIFPWNNFQKVHQLIQFPWRFMILPTILFPIMAGLSIGSFRGCRIKRIIAMIIFIASIIVAFPILNNVITNYIQLSPGYRGIQDGIGAGEYLPAGAVFREIKEQGKNIRYDIGDDENKDFEFTYSEKGFEGELVYRSKNDITVEFPFLFYKGWLTQTGDKKPVPTKIGPHGLVCIELPAEPNHGITRIYYQKTVIQWISEFLSLFGMICLINLLSNKRRRSVRNR